MHAPTGEPSPQPTVEPTCAPYDEKSAINSATLEELRNQLETTSNAAMSSFKSMHSELQAKLAAHDDAIKTNAQVAAAKSTELQEKLVLEIAAQTERIANHSKHFAATVANVEPAVMPRDATFFFTTESPIR